MDLQVLILDYVLTERAGIILLLLATILYVFQQNKTLSAIEKELVSVKDKINKLVNRTDDATSDLSSLSSRISNLSGAVSEANTVAEGTKKELSMLAEGINSETVFNEAIDLARKGSSVEEIVTQTKLSKDQAETIVRFHGKKA
jgi:chromosome segregation ATPase